MFTNRSRASGTAGSNQAFGVDAAFSFFQDVSLFGYERIRDRSRTISTLAAECLI